MNRLRYIFWVSPLFFFAGCAAERVVLTYRSEFLQMETATARPAGLAFDPPALADTNAFGSSEIAGVNLNSRQQVSSTAGEVDLDDTTDYRLYYSDRQGHLGHHGHHGQRLYRTFRYYRRGDLAR